MMLTQQAQAQAQSQSQFRQTDPLLQQHQDNRNRDTKDRLCPGFAVRKRPGSPTLEFAARNQRPRMHQLQPKSVETFPKNNLSLLGRHAAVERNDRASRSNSLKYLTTVSTRNEYLDRARPPMSDGLSQPIIERENHEWLEIPLQASNRFSPTFSDSSARSPSPPEIYHCDPVCGAWFTGQYRKGNFARHKRLKHGSSRLVYYCEVRDCNKFFKRSDACFKHYRIHHPGLGPSFVLSRRAPSSRLSAPSLGVETSIELGRPASPRQHILGPLDHLALSPTCAVTHRSACRIYPKAYNQRLDLVQCKLHYLTRHDVRNKMSR
jgi:hypothetical protein